MPGGGPTRIITDLGVLGFDDSGEAVLTEVYPGVTPERVQAACGWPLRVAPEVKTSDSPDSPVLHLLREKLDPKRLYL
jgi:glutaconate CoA-transferase subunit B